MNTTGNSSPLPLWTVSTCTAGVSTSASATAGSSPASMSASRCFTNSRMLSYFNALLASRMRRKNLEMFWTSASSRAVVALDMRASQPGVDQELVQQLAGRHLPGQLHVADEIADQLVNRQQAFGRDLGGQLAILVHRPQHVEEPAVLAVGVGRAPREVHDGHLVEVGRRQVVHAHRVVGVRDRSQKRQQQPHLGPAVQPGVARERPRDAAQVERAQKLVGVVVGAHQHRHVGEPPRPVLHVLANHLRDGVGLLGGRLVVQRARAPVPAARAPRSECLHDPAARLRAGRDCCRRSADAPRRARPGASGSSR